MKQMKFSYQIALHGLPHGLRCQRGITLVEWMVSITIGLILLAGMTTLIAQQSSTQAELEKSSRQIENGRYAMQVLSEDIQLAGYYGEFSNVADLPVPVALPDPCADVVADIEPAMVFPVQGYDDLTTGLPSCINAANHLDGTDILVLRRVETVAVAIASAASATVYLQSGLTSSGLEFEKKMDFGSNAADFDLYKKDKTTLAPLRKFLVHIYFVSPCSVPVGSNCSGSADGGKPIPTLKVWMSETGNSTPLVEGIENMQIDYGFDTSGDGSPDSYATDAAPVADWATSPETKAHWGNVMALQLHLLARSNESSAGYLDSKTYNLGLSGTTTATNDHFKRRVFSQMIRVVNPSSRRDQ